MIATELARIETLQPGDIIVSNGEQLTVKGSTGAVVRRGRGRNRVRVRWTVQCTDGTTFTQDHGYLIKVAR